MFLVKIPAVDVGNHILQKFQVLVPKKVFPGIHVHTWLYFKWKKHMSTQEQEELDGIRRSPYHHWCSKTLPQSPPSIGNRFRERLQFLTCQKKERANPRMDLSLQCNANPVTYFLHVQSSKSKDFQKAWILDGTFVMHPYSLVSCAGKVIRLRSLTSQNSYVCWEGFSSKLGHCTPQAPGTQCSSNVTKLLQTLIFQNMSHLMHHLAHCLQTTLGLNPGSLRHLVNPFFQLGRQWCEFQKYEPPVLCGSILQPRR